MRLYRVYIGLETKTDHGRRGAEERRDIAISIIPNWIAGATIYDTIGYWDGAKESSLVVEYVGQERDIVAIRGYAKRVRDRLDQDSVLVTSQEIVAELIEADKTVILS